MAEIAWLLAAAAVALASLVQTESSFRKNVRSHIGAVGPAQVEGEGGPIEESLAEGGQEVLARVVLHVVPAPLPVEPDGHRPGRQG